MKKTFNKQYILDNKGCYDEDQVLALACINKEVITLQDLADCLPIKDLSWFFVKKCELTIIQKQKFAIYCAELVLPIYEKEYPNDSRVKDCIEATKLYIDGKISINELKVKRSTAYAAYDASASASAYAAYAAYAAAANAAYAAFAFAYAANAAEGIIRQYILTL